MTVSALGSVVSMRLDGDGTMRIVLADGQVASAPLGREASVPTSAIASSTYFPHLSRLWLQTTRGDNVVLEIPTPLDLSPRSDRPAIYLDQNHWSTLADTIHDPARVKNAEERSAAERLIAMAVQREVILPLSSGHASETCKQEDPEDRYRRALTMAQLSSGWQLRDPLAVRRFELRQALAVRYRHCCLIPPAVVTLEPNGLHAGSGNPTREVDESLPEDARWAVYAISCIGGIIDTLLDAEHVPMPAAAGWADELQRFAAFLAANPTGKEILRRRTHAKFIVDLGRELPEEACRVGVSPEEVSDWTLHHSEEDLRRMPSLGLFREVLHEKLSDPKLRWEANDLIDMMYLTAGAAYCDHVIAERRHASYITNGLRRLGVERVVHRNIRSVIDHL